MSIKAEEVRAILAASGRPYDERSKRAAVEYARGRGRAGVAITRVGHELGISPATLVAWLKMGSFIPVEVVDGPIVESQQGVILIDTRSGLRVEGLTVDTVVQILERLR